MCGNVLPLTMSSFPKGAPGCGVNGVRSGSLHLKSKIELRAPGSCQSCRLALAPFGTLKGEMFTFLKTELQRENLMCTFLSHTLALCRRPEAMLQHGKSNTFSIQIY